jgi:DNA-directed RNA polymerase specialized sigma24 family protein
MAWHTEMGGSNIGFPTTAWTQIRNAQGVGEERERGWDHLGRMYWKPVYAIIMNWVKNNEKAKDLTQDFFERQLSNPAVVATADKSLGRFRVYLKNRLVFFLREQHKKARARLTEASLDVLVEEGQEPVAPGAGPFEEFMDRSLAETPGGRAKERLEDHYRATGKERRLRIMDLRVDGRKTFDIARETGESEDTVKNDVRAYKRDYGRMLLQIIRSTVDSDDLVEDEKGELDRIIGRGRQKG